MPPESRTSRGRFRRSRLPVAILASAIAAVFAGVFVATQPPRLRLLETELSPNAVDVVPINAFGTGEDCFAIPGGSQLILANRVQQEARSRWQHNFPFPVSLDGGIDVDGDGLEEIVVSGVDSSGACVMVLDARGRMLHTLGPVPAIGRRSSGRPDIGLQGRARLDHPRRGLLCMQTAERAQREVALYDLATGQRVWSFSMGAWPQSLATADLDGDGQAEVLVETGSPGNGVSSNGTDDLHAYALALKASGERLWQTPLAGTEAWTYLLPVPPDADGRPRVLATVHTHRGENPEPGTVAVLDGPSGRILVRRTFPESMGRPCLLAEGRPRVAVGSSGGKLRLFDMELNRIAERDFGAELEVWGVADLDSDGENEIVASTARQLFILDQRLRRRMTSSFETRASGPVRIRFARAGPARWRLCYSAGRAVAAGVESTPPLRDTPRLALALAFMVASGAAASLVDRRVRRRRRPCASEAHDFLTEFVQIQHETFAETTPFAALRRWDQATTGGVAPAETLEQAGGEFMAIGAPMLRRFADRTAALGSDPGRAQWIRTFTTEIEGALRDAIAAPASRRPELVRTVVDRMDALSAECRAAHRDVADPLGCRTDIVAQEALRAKQAALVHTGVAFHLAVEPGGARPVLFDADELRTLIGELLENATRALVGRLGAEVHAEVKGHPRDPRWVLVTISDNGPGFRATDRESAFSPDYSSREGGGFGLHSARQTARRWLGDLAIEEPVAEGGARLRLTLRVLFPHEEARTP